MDKPSGAAVIHARILRQRTYLGSNPEMPNRIQTLLAAYTSYEYTYKFYIKAERVW